MTIKAVDFFCGAGGLTHGLVQSGVNVVAGIDIDPSCRYSYEENNKGAKFVHADVKTVCAQKIKKYLKGATRTVLVGCAPCQPFSSYTKNVRKNALKNNGQWALITNFLAKIEEINPDVVSMENVPSLRMRDIFSSFVEKLESMEYSVSSQIVNCAQYGVPQSRKRLVLLASKHGDISLPEPFQAKNKTLKDAIGKLPHLDAGKKHADDPMHVSSRLSELNMKRMKASTPGGCWHDWDKKLLPDCYKSPSGKTFLAVYGRLSWDKPAPTITTQFHRYGSGRFGHPEQDRAISLREGAILQTFPPKYKFFEKGEKVIFGIAAKHIGNAVPPQLGKVVGKTIIGHLENVA